jgi:hexosaminidase
MAAVGALIRETPLVLVLLATSLACSGQESEPGDGLRVDHEPIAPLTLIPWPRAVTGSVGHVYLSDATRIVAAPGVEAIADLLAARLRPATGWRFEVVTGPARAGDITLELRPDQAGAGDESYELAVSPNGVSLIAPSAEGLFNATQTLRQLLPVAIEQNEHAPGAVWKLPRVIVQDRPRFAWRGAMLDVARHFFDVATVERVIDLLALHKQNRLHLHLTDDQGWRIQIDAWPKLTEIGGSTAVGGGAGGWYTKADYTRIVDYAAARFITVVPEIDMPGHTNAALASYAELNESGVPAEPYTGTGVGFSSLWVGGPATRGFVEDVVREVGALTKGPWLHVGGDEAKATSHQDYAAFLQMVQQIVDESGKTLVGWEEIATAGLASPFVAQHWLDANKARSAASQGARVIASPATHAYLDMKYDATTPIGNAWVGFVGVQRAYEWEPVLEGLAESDVIGVEAPLWTETVGSVADIELLMFPRLAGHAEIAWSPAEGRSFDEYHERLGRYGARLEALGVGYYRAPDIDWESP